jgi:hypothetical protein
MFLNKEMTTLQKLSRLLVNLIQMMNKNNERPTETLIHGFTESQCIRDLQDKIVELAPAEGQCPLGIFKDKFVEEMNFPTLFYGDPHDNDIME